MREASATCLMCSARLFSPDVALSLSWLAAGLPGAGEEKMNRAPAENAVVFTEVPQPAKLPTTASFLEIVLHSGHMVRVPAGADTDTLQRVFQALQTTC